MSRIVGIDLGTTTSEIAYIRNGKPEIIKNGYSSITPSVVGLDKNLEILVGQSAKNQLVSAKERTVAEVKRKMGTSDAVLMAGKKFTPVEISAIILRELKKIGEDFLQEEITGAVITVPANFNDAQRQATKEAGEKAGLVVERIINEPTAAALAFGIDNMETEGKILVYDLGGGTFDVTGGKNPDELKQGSKPKAEKPVTQKQIKYLETLMSQHNTSAEAMNKYCKSNFGVDDYKKITGIQASTLIEKFKAVE